MKILMVSMPSLHFFRWTEQLKDESHEVYWFDITGNGTKVERLNWVTQFVDWKIRWNFPGRIFLKKNFPKIYKLIQKVNERKVSNAFGQKLNEIQPDIVHSFALYVSCTPILECMQRNKIKWIYSSWGSDLFYYKNIPNYRKDIELVLPRIDYLFTDCKRDFDLAKQMGFKGQFLGVFPGGGGFDIDKIEKYSKPINIRKIVLIKGFENRSGRAINVLKALILIKKALKKYKIIVFGSDRKIFKFVKDTNLKEWNNFEALGKIPHEEVFKLMGESLVYIGNSNSDGLPNTLLEAICSGAFPIQSNPGGATEELIENKVNGILINDYEAIDEIKNNILYALSSKKVINDAFNYNQKLKLNLERVNIQKKVIEKYLEIKS